MHLVIDTTRMIPVLLLDLGEIPLKWRGSVVLGDIYSLYTVFVEIL